MGYCREARYRAVLSCAVVRYSTVTVAVQQREIQLTASNMQFLARDEVLLREGVYSLEGRAIRTWELGPFTATMGGSRSSVAHHE